MSESDSFDPRAFHAQFSIAMIVACAKNGIIGRDGDLPWHLPEDLRHFMRSTKGCPVVMGRKTFDSLEKPLPARLNIVVSHSMPDQSEGTVRVARSLEDAIDQARASIESGMFQGPIWIAGGGTIYTQGLPMADLIVETRIEAEVEGDASFPDLDQDRWVLSRKKDHEADEKNAYGFRIGWWTKRSLPQ